MITIVDYGMGNLRSVSKALEHLGAKVRISSRPGEIEDAEKIILPGVGAFGDAAEGLRSQSLLAPLRSHITSGRPFLGICLGLQLLFESSEETPGIKGISVLKGAVRRFRSKDVKVPHMGWNQVKIRNSHPILTGIPENSYFYFVHSFYAVPEETAVIAAACQYGSEEFTAIVGSNNVVATQFHPEKSQRAGLQLLKNFVEW